MLRRVGLPHRQHLEHIVVLTGCRDLRAHPRVAFPLICIRWSTAVAQASRSKPHRPSDDVEYNTRSLNKYHILPMQRSKEASHTKPSKAALSSAVPPDVDTLLSQPATEKSLLKTIRKSPHLVGILTDAKKVRGLAEAAARSPQPIHSVRLLRLAHRLGCHLKPGIYESVAFHLANAKHWDIILSVVWLGKRQMGRASYRLLNWRARALIETQHYTLLQGILEEFKKHNVQPTRRTFHLLLSGHIQNRNLPQAKQTLQDMTEAGFPADASTHAIVATHYRTFGGDPQVQSRSLEALHGVASTTAATVLNSLLQLRLDAHDVRGALQLLSLFDRQVVHAIVVEMSPADGDGSSQHAPDSIPPLTRQRIHPNAGTFSLFINHMATQSNLHGALRIFHSMMHHGIEPTPNTISSLINVFFSAEQGDIAVRIVAEMCDSSKAPLPMFHPILSALPKDTLPWVPTGMSPTIQIFNALLRGVLHAYGLEASDVVIRIMLANDITPNYTTLETLASHLSKDQMASPAMMLRFLRAFRSSTFRPTLRLMHAVLSRVLRREKFLHFGVGWDATAAKFSPIRQEYQNSSPGNEPSDVPVSFDPAAGIELPRSLSHRPLANSLLQSLAARGVKSDAPMVALRIQFDALNSKAMESAQESFHALLVRGLRPNEYHYSALMETLTRSGDIQGALEVMKSAEQAGIRPNTVMFTILIVAHARQGKPDSAIRVFQHMVSAGIKPDVPSIDAVTSAFFAIGEYVMAKRVLMSLWPHIEPFPKEMRNSSLKHMARVFRRRHGRRRWNGEEGESFTKDEQLALHQKMNTLLASWKQQSKERKVSMRRLLPATLRTGRS